MVVSKYLTPETSTILREEVRVFFDTVKNAAR